MKKVTDILQIALTMPDAFGYLASVLIVLSTLQVCKLFTITATTAIRAIRIARRGIIRLTWWRMAAAALVALPLYAFRYQAADTLQIIEQTLQPAYVTADTSRHALAIYEAQLARRVDAYELEIVKQRTRDIAQKLSSTPLAIYEVAHSECGLDPFRIRDDGIAAGWIQFTRAGLQGIATLEQVKAACRARDIAAMMNWTEQYLTTRAAGKPLPDAAAVYVAVFAPGHIGAPDAQVLYSGYTNPEYYLNSIFDGYYTTSAGQIFRTRAAQDGKITIKELRLHLEAKKSALIRRAT